MTGDALVSVGPGRWSTVAILVLWSDSFPRTGKFSDCVVLVMCSTSPGSQEHQVYLVIVCDVVTSSQKLHHANSGLGTQQSLSVGV